MRERLQIQDIEDMRRRAGIDDVELRQAIRGLRVGALVRLTLLTGAPGAAGETLVFRITSIRAGAFRGRLASRPTSAGLSDLRVGRALIFTQSHIHSLPRMRPDTDGECAVRKRARQSSAADLLAGPAPEGVP
ncbi:MAG TPA: hypothetical protein VFW33_18075 [Gemmataceae bacterium]|nr:hypothetical protein [Gemmataceae bacterium]